jgi:hypothetical protein
MLESLRTKDSIHIVSIIEYIIRLIQMMSLKLT